MSVADLVRPPMIFQAGLFESTHHKYDGSIMGIMPEGKPAESLL